MRSNPGLFTFLIVILTPVWVWSQDHPYPALESTAARVILRDPQETKSPLGSRQPETRADKHYATFDENTGSFVPPEPGAASVDSVVQPLPEYSELANDDEARFGGQFSTDSSQFDIGLNLYSAPPFKGGLIVFGPNVALKIGGFVKADFIYDFNPIDSTDSFVTTSIPVDAPPRTNSRFHARQSRLSFDTRWLSDDRLVRIYVEGDFFSEDDQFRLRQAFGEVGPLLVGRTWTTFTDVAAAPATLDFEGSVSNVNRRQAQARWTQIIFHEDLKLALAVEDTQFIIDAPTGITGEARNPSPDFVGHLRLDRERAQIQVASLFRIAGFQPTGQPVITKSAWGLNFTGVFLVTETTKVYSQILFGEGIGSYRDLPDAAPTAVDQGGLLPMFGWMVGATHNWNESLSSNFTYAQNDLGTTAFQNPNDVDQTTYLSANIIWSPLERVKVGVEYLYGTRKNVNGAMGDAHRLQASFIFDLP